MVVFNILYIMYIIDVIAFFRTIETSDTILQLILTILNSIPPKYNGL
jgi:hypothetical protein